MSIKTERDASREPVVQTSIARGRPFVFGSAHASNCGRQSQRVARLAQPRNARGQYQRSTSEERIRVRA
jgi:hypothetical protein